MARRDFVRRTKKTSKKKRSVKKKVRLLKYLFFFLILIILIVAGYLIFSQQQSKAPKTLEALSSQMQKSENKKMAVAPPKDLLPSEPEQRSSYLQCLELQNCDTQVTLNHADEFNHIQAELKAQQRADQNLTDKQQALAIFSNQSSRTSSSVTQTSNPTIENKQIKPTKGLNNAAFESYQCGAFKQQNNAESLSAKLSFIGVVNQIIHSSDLFIVVIQLPSAQVPTTLSSLKEYKINCSKRSS